MTVDDYLKTVEKKYENTALWRYMNNCIGLFSMTDPICTRHCNELISCLYIQKNGSRLEAIKLMEEKISKSSEDSLKLK